MKSYYDLSGDGGSNVLEQVEARERSIVQSLSRVRHIVAVGSGKGGVGKSTLTMQLACALRERGNAVSILDADLNGPCQARLGGLQDGILIPGTSGARVPTTCGGIGVVSTGTWISESRAVELPSVATGSEYTWRATQEFTILRQMLAGMDWGELDFLLVDLPPGAERIVQYAELLGERALFVLVTIPSDMARSVVARSIHALENGPNRILGYVENMDGYYCADCGSVKSLFTVSPELELDIPRLGGVPFDPELALLCDRGVSLEGASQLFSWQPVRRIAEEVSQRVSELVRSEKENQKDPKEKP